MRVAFDVAQFAGASAVTNHRSAPSARFWLAMARDSRWPSVTTRRHHRNLDLVDEPVELVQLGVHVFDSCPSRACPSGAPRRGERTSTGLASSRRVSARAAVASCDGAPLGSVVGRSSWINTTARSMLVACYRREPDLAFGAAVFFAPAPTAAGSFSSSSGWAASAAPWLIPPSASPESFSSAAFSRQGSPGAGPPPPCGPWPSPTRPTSRRPPFRSAPRAARRQSGRRPSSSHRSPLP